MCRAVRSVRSVLHCDLTVACFYRRAVQLCSKHQLLVSHKSISEGGSRNNVGGGGAANMSYAETVPPFPPLPNISLRLININIDVATSLLGLGD
jgi:hypothetical protein